MRGDRAFDTTAGTPSPRFDFSPRFFEALVEQLSEDGGDQWPDVWRPVIEKLEIGDSHTYALWRVGYRLEDFDPSEYGYMSQLENLSFWLENCEFEGDSKMDGRFLWEMPGKVREIFDSKEYLKVRVC